MRADDDPDVAILCGCVLRDPATTSSASHSVTVAASALQCTAFPNARVQATLGPGTIFPRSAPRPGRPPSQHVPIKLASSHSRHGHLRCRLWFPLPRKPPEEDVEEETTVPSVAVRKMALTGQAQRDRDHIGPHLHHSIAGGSVWDAPCPVPAPPGLLREPCRYSEEFPLSPLAFFLQPLSPSRGPC